MQLWILPLDVQTDRGKRACQQILMDLGRFWQGQPVEYLSVYRSYVPFVEDSMRRRMTRVVVGGLGVGAGWGWEVVVWITELLAA